MLLLLKVMPELRASGDLDFLRKFKNFLGLILFPRLFNMSVVPGEKQSREIFSPNVMIFKSNWRLYSVDMHNRNPLFLDVLKKIFLEVETRKPSSSFSEFMHVNLFGRCDDLLAGLLDLNKSKKIRLSTKLIEMTVAANEFVNRKGL